ncbi:MAG TPA: potassium transporter TrkG [Saprospiraceae bacterium]|nr:potassium transporter TrkG [Saprospiraceae bacterium]HMP24071.1 potassium transporter TrkG [Saprospiraceae bacterium]
MAQFPLRAVSLAAGLVAVLTFIYDIGYEVDRAFTAHLPLYYFILLNTFIFLNIVKRLTTPRSAARRSQIAVILLFIGGLLYILTSVFSSGRSLEAILMQQLPLLRICVLLFFTIEYSTVIQRFYSSRLQPAFIFAFSFALLIAVGTLLLKLPMATVGSISFADALFMATSAVCVTGLVVADVGQDFTPVGQWVIMLLFQAGGLGMLTLTSFFAYFFKENMSYRESLFVKDFVNSNQFSNIFRLTVNIVALTLTVEIIGALLIYAYIPKDVIPNQSERIFFAIFHAVSAFCNAGFSTLSNSLYEESFRFNYFIHFIIAILFIFGGLGYNIMFNMMDYIREKMLTLIKKHISNEVNYRKRPRVVTLNSKIVIYTTLILMGVGTLFFFFLEYNNVLDEHATLSGKLVTSFFGAVTPRTAGFNTVDTGSLHISTIMIVLLLMWIGAAPASTGGGIKTSTFAIATLNIFSLARGKTSITVGRRVISDYSVRKSAAIISLSFIFIGFGVMLVASFEESGPADFLRIVFECFSAYCTVGLSMGITGSLSDESKLVLVLLMFIGRVGAINLLIGMLRRLETSHIRYPEEDILIN